jgi:hypothetical protein
MVPVDHSRARRWIGYPESLGSGVGACRVLRLSSNRERWGNHPVCTCSGNRGCTEGRALVGRSETCPTGLKVSDGIQSIRA